MRSPPSTARYRQSSPGHLRRVNFYLSSSEESRTHYARGWCLKSPSTNTYHRCELAVNDSAFSQLSYASKHRAHRPPAPGAPPPQKARSVLMSSADIGRSKEHPTSTGRRPLFTSKGGRGSQGSDTVEYREATSMALWCSQRRRDRRRDHRRDRQRGDSRDRRHPKFYRAVRRGLSSTTQ